MILSFCDEIEPQQRNRAFAVDRGVILDARRNPQRVRKVRELADDFLRHSAGRDNFKIVVAGQRLHRRTKRSGGGKSREIDREHDGDSERDRQHGERRTHRLRQKRPNHQAIK